MANADDKSKEYPSFLTCRLTKEGGISGFHICSAFERALDWSAQDKAKRERPNAGSEEKADRPSQSQERVETVKSEEPSFGHTLSRFVTSMRSFYDLISVNSVARTLFPSVFIEREFDEYRKNILPVIQNDSEYVYHGIPESQISSINLKTKRLDHLKEGMASLPATALMGLVARYDANIGGLVRFLLQTRKERLGGNEKTIPIRDVLAASSFDDLVSTLIDDEIYSLMRGSHEDQVKYIEDTFSIKIRDHYKRWPEFVEVFERRNLAAHGEGFANARYVRICASAKVSAKGCLSLGDPIKLSDGYLRNSVDILLEFGILLIWWLWLKQMPNDADAAYNAMNDVTYDLIVDKRYRLASWVLESALNRKTERTPETIRRMMAVNLANCEKKLKNDSASAAALKLFDWTASADSYQISVASLQGDIDKVCALMPRVSDEMVIEKAGFRDWPVFDWILNDDRVKERFKEVFGEPIGLVAESGKATAEISNSNVSSTDGGSPPMLH